MSSKSVGEISSDFDIEVESYTEVEDGTPPNKIQIKYIEKHKKLKLNQKAYVISQAWINSLKESISDESKKMIPIDNSDLLDKNGKLDFANKEKGKDFIVISETAWKKIHKWNGGGPQIKLDTVDVGGKVKSLIPMNAKVNCRATEKAIQTYKYEKCADFKKRSLSLFSLAETTESRLLDYKDKQFHEIMDDDKFLKDYNISANQNIYLDIKNNRGNWISNFKDSNKPIFVNSRSDYFDNYNSHNSSSGYSPAFSVHTYGGYGVSSCGPAPAPGLVGLKNLSNTCFFNSGVQCLLHTNPFKQLFLHSDWEKDLNPTNPIGMKGKLAQAFISLFKEVWSGKNAVVSPAELKRTIGEFTERFSGWGQQDSHELITFMLDGLSEDLNRRTKKEYVENIVGDGTNDEEIAKLSWDNFKKRSDSIIVDTFYGQLRSKLYCPNCHIITVIFEPYFSLSLPLTKPHPKTIDITFVPYDYKEQRLKLDLIVRPPININNISKAISEIVKREVNIVVGYKENDYSNTFIWRIEKSSSNIKPHYYAFEIPKIEQCYIIGTMKLKLEDKMLYNDSSTEKEIIPPMLIPISNLNATEEEISISASNRLSSLWEENNDIQETSYIKDIITRLKLPTNNNFDDDIKIHITISKFSLGKTNNNNNNNRKSDFPFLKEYSVNLILNSKYVTPEKGFSTLSLLRHYEFNKEHHKHRTESDVNITLEKCFEYYTTNEILDEDNKWYCPHCKQHVCADKQLDIWSVPKCLILHLKRFIANRYSTEKLNKSVNYPMEIDLSNFVKGKNVTNNSLKYKLYAISEHIGGMGSGHYATHAINVLDHHVHGKWYNFNDSSVKESTEEKAKHQCNEAYVLFYERIDPDEKSEPVSESDEEINQMQINIEKETDEDYECYIKKAKSCDELNRFRSIMERERFQGNIDQIE
ncbi:Clan CA, family C19, ubiquitin hydrolase-like cysteine peptidase [Histomonas meleagridis]|uniref:Clan CA, family C19, ubiquitin hydrolase-like cysteine peptidase n=1 Tax=Histomonas meleagridis TaxID=135588 RepID=UPI0035595E19|nr:Clan CA, family C19, ubiquitin hydrolase-like cysteine peptidase [Histomonas meleagridis]KAH0804130.1 Clan CA, family C19, ubiquitin hydrolase-like cysteine peptidase [Histomonas meleagridis]